MPHIQFRNYFEARLAYLQTQGIAEPMGPLEELSFTELRTVVSETDTQAEKERPEYWQNMLKWYNEEGSRSLGGEKPASGIFANPRWNQTTPEEIAKQTLQMIERYLTSKARTETPSQG